MIDPTSLQSHLDDYERVFGEKTDRFVCPITLHKCNEEELMNGHILNGALRTASRRRVIQYAAVDHFYGTRVEPEFVRYMNSKDLSDAELLASNKGLCLEFNDGTSVPAFLATGPSASAARGRFPIVEVLLEKSSVTVFATTEANDPRLHDIRGLSGRFNFIQSHWIAAILKFAHLAMFDLIGYRSIATPLGDTLRRTLAMYFNDSASRKEAREYFSDFPNAMKLLGKGALPSDFRKDYKPFDFDTLEDRLVLLHFAGASQNIMFAATMMFGINGTTTTATLPATATDHDVTPSWSLYRRLMADDPTLEQRIHRAQYDGRNWKLEEKPLKVEMPR